MKRMIQLASLACTLAGGALLSRPAPASATMAPQPLKPEGILSCCKATDGSAGCCFQTGCAIAGGHCIQIG